MALDRQEQTAAHRFAIEQHGTGPADAMFASQMGSRQIEIVAQKIGQTTPRFYCALKRLPVHPEANGMHTTRHASSSLMLRQ
jgi:hypothetical protein